MVKKVLLQLILPMMSLCILFFLLGTAPAERDQKRERREVSVIFREDDGVWANAREGMEQAAADLGIELRFLLPSGANDPAEQKRILVRELDTGAKGVILYPSDREILRPVLETAACTVVTLEADMRQMGADAYIGVENRTFGETMGRAVLNGVPAGGTVLLLDTVPGDNGVRERMEAVRRVLEESERRTEFLQTGSGRGLAEPLTRYLEEHEVHALIAFESSALETAAELMDTLHQTVPGGPVRVPLLYGMGATPAIAAGLERNHITALEAQNDFSAGYLAVAAAVQGMETGRAESPEPLPSSLVRRENMYDEDRQKLLFPVTR